MTDNFYLLKKFVDFTLKKKKKNNAEKNVKLKTTDCYWQKRIVELLFLIF